MDDRRRDHDRPAEDVGRLRTRRSKESPMGDDIDRREFLEWIAAFEGEV